MPTDVKALLVTSPAWPPVRLGGRVGPLWRIKQAPAEIQGWNTMRGRICKVVETLFRREVDVFCIQETRYRGGSCRTIKSKDTTYKLYWSGSDKGTAGVGVFVAEEWIEKVFDVQSLRQNHLSEAYSRPACGYLSVSVCPTEWSVMRLRTCSLTSCVL